MFRQAPGRISQDDTYMAAGHTELKKLHHVSVEVPQIVLYDDLKKKIAEVRVKRDSLMLAHSVVNLYQDRYNKFIIVLSLMSAFFESTKAQLNLAERNDWVAPVSTLAPILLATVLGIVSSLMKFKKFPERMEMLTKATEKGNATILQMRRLIENLNFQPYEVSYDEYSNGVTLSYRDALDHHERALYPHEHDIYHIRAVGLAAAIRAREDAQETAIDALLEAERAKHKRVLSRHDGNVQLGTPLKRAETMPLPTGGGDEDGDEDGDKELRTRLDGLRGDGPGGDPAGGPDGAGVPEHKEEHPDDGAA